MPTLKTCVFKWRFELKKALQKCIIIFIINTLPYLISDIKYFENHCSKASVKKLDILIFLWASPQCVQVTWLVSCLSLCIYFFFFFEGGMVCICICHIYLFLSPFSLQYIFALINLLFVLFTSSLFLFTLISALIGTSCPASSKVSSSTIVATVWVVAIVRPATAGGDSDNYYSRITWVTTNVTITNYYGDIKDDTRTYHVWSTFR